MFRNCSKKFTWTKEHLLDPEDGLYFDNIGLDGKIGRAKFAYNSGQMVQAGALLYKATGDESYLKDAQRTAAACYDRFFGEFTPEGGETFRIINKGNVWFSAVMVRGLAELYAGTTFPIYLLPFLPQPYSYRISCSMTMPDWNCISSFSLDSTLMVEISRLTRSLSNSGIWQVLVLK